jgi:hypothetical protein
LSRLRRTHGENRSPPPRPPPSLGAWPFPSVPRVPPMSA